MKFTYQQLLTHLNNNLLPLYVLVGSDPLLIQEAKDNIRETAKKSGFLEARHFETSKDFDWNVLHHELNNYSLFSEKIRIELQLMHKPNTLGTKILNDYASLATKEKLLIIITEKVDASIQKSEWFSAISKIGAIVNLWPLEHSQFQQWIVARLQKNGLTCDQHSIHYIAQHTEGNLLAAAQEIEKLKLIFSSGHISHDDIVNAVGDLARFDIFNLIDTILQNDTLQVLRILNNLRAEGIETTLVLWALTRELRTITNILNDVEKKLNWDAIVKKYQIWQKRQPLLKKAINLNSIKNLSNLLLKAAHIDKMIKGLEKGNVWDELTSLALQFCNSKPLIKF